MKIRVGQLLAASDSNGPYRRSVLWVQGCPFRCEGCWNQELLTSEGGKLMSIDELEHFLCSEAVEGVTFLGGEPFAQADALCELAQRVKLRGLGVMAYSGFSRAQLENGALGQRALLAECDLLVDGLYVPTQAAELLWRGSKNQRLHFLTPRYADWRSMDEKPYRNFEAFIQADGTMTLTGDPDTLLFDTLSGAQSHG